MKAWNKPELAEINIDETQNGIFCLGFEWCLVSHDHNNDCGQKKEEGQKTEEGTTKEPTRTVTNEWS